MIRPEDRKLFEASLASNNPTAQLSDAVRRLIREFGRSREDIMEELEEFRDILRDEDRDSDEDIVLEVMDFLVGWASPHVRIHSGERVGQSPVSSGSGLTLRSVFPATSGGVWTNSGQAARFRDLFFPAMTVQTPTTIILNLCGIIPAPSVLQELLLPLAARVRSGALGPQTLVVQTHDHGVRDFVNYLAREFDLPLYVTLLGQSLPDAEPGGHLTGTLKTTLNVIRDLGGEVSASELAKAVGIEPTAAGNRLSDLAEKGYIVKDTASRRHRFADPRFAQPVKASTGRA